MDIIIPMAGAGKRFKDAGYNKPKPLIDVNGRPMISRVIENLGRENNFTFIVQKDHYETYFKEFDDAFGETNAHWLVTTDGLTGGALQTILLARGYIDPTAPVMIANSDQIVGWDRREFYDWFYTGRFDFEAAILTFESQNPAHSYIKVNDKGFVTEIAEKQVISDKATVGVYVWRFGSDFLIAADEVIKRQMKYNGEYYLSPTFNINIEDGILVREYKVPEPGIVGTPEALEKWLNEHPR